MKDWQVCVDLPKMLIKKLFYSNFFMLKFCKFFPAILTTQTLNGKEGSLIINWQDVVVLGRVCGLGSDSFVLSKLKTPDVIPICTFSLCAPE